MPIIDKNISFRRMPFFGQWLIGIFIIIATASYLWQINEFDKEIQRIKLERVHHLLEKTKFNLNLLINELRRDVVLLSQAERPRILRLISDPDNQDAYAELIDRIKSSYPEVFAVTLTDNEGKAIVVDFEGFIQQVCINDINKFASSGVYEDLYIHPNPFLYHFDMMTNIVVEKKDYIFFVSFNASLISNFLKNNGIQGYQLMLVNTEIDDLIEVTIHGSRNVLDGDNTLDEIDKANLIGEIDIPQTRWKLLVFESENNLTGEFSGTPRSHIWPIILFNMICIAALILLQLMKARLKGQGILLEEQTSALDFSRERLIAVFASVLDSMVTIDKHGIITNFNPAAEKMFGYSLDEVLGKNVKILMPEPYHKEHDGYIKSYMETGEAKIIGTTRKVIGKNKSGEQFPIELSVSEVKHHHTIEFVGVVRDITHRMMVEKMKSEFISTVSHEMRTPLTSIRGSLGLIAGGAMGEVDIEIKKLIDISIKNTNRMIKMINEILDIDRIDSGNMLFHFSNVSLKSIVLDSINNIRGVADDRSIDIDFRCLHESCSIRADEGRMIQVVVNLLSNAIKFSGPGSTVNIVLDCSDDSCTLSIKDTGIGISSKDKESIFDKFTQVDSSDTRDVGGSGLGLSIVKSIISAHQGTITLESQPGKGSTFIVQLPR